MNGNPLDDVIFAAETLCNFWIEESHEAERSEGLRNENIGDLSKLREVIAKIVLRQVFSAAAYEHLAGNLLDLSFFGVWHFHFTPSTIDVMALAQDSQLCLVAGESNEAKTLRLAFVVFLDLYHQDLSEGLEILAQSLLTSLPGEAKDNQIGAFVGLAFGHLRLRDVFHDIVGLALVL